MISGSLEIVAKIVITLAVLYTLFRTEFISKTDKIISQHQSRVVEGVQALLILFAVYGSYKAFLLFWPLNQDITVSQFLFVMTPSILLLFLPYFATFLYFEGFKKRALLSVALGMGTPLLSIAAILYIIRGSGGDGMALLLVIPIAFYSAILSYLVLISTLWEYL